MAKQSGFLLKEKETKFLIAAVAISLIFLLGFLLYRYAILDKINNYLIQNKYYGFSLKTPKNWVAVGKAFYSEENISQILNECKNDKSGENSTYEIGRFKFENQKYPQGFGEAGYFPSGFSSGAILDVRISCVPEDLKDKIAGYSAGNLQIAGEKAFSEFLDLLGFGKTKYFSVLHNNLRYEINEYVYISPADAGNNEEKLKENYNKIFNEVISSFKFVK